jgi:hypothetical protein
MFELFFALAGPKAIGFIALWLIAMVVAGPALGAERPRAVYFRRGSKRNPS